MEAVTRENGRAGVVPDELAEARGIRQELGIYLGELEVFRRSHKAIVGNDDR